MERIEYSMPALINSTKEIKVRMNTGTEVFILQKYFKNRFQRISNAIIPKFDTNIVVKKQGKVVAQSKDIFTFSRHK